MFSCGLGILMYIYYQPSLHEFRFLNEILNCLTIFYLIVQRQPNFQSINEST